MLRSTVNSLGNPYSETWMRKRKGWGREDLQNRPRSSIITAVSTTVDHLARACKLQLQEIVTTTCNLHRWRKSNKCGSRAFSADRAQCCGARVAAERVCSWYAAPAFAAVDRYLLVQRTQQETRRPRLLTMTLTDGQIDGQTTWPFDRPSDPALHFTRAVSKSRTYVKFIICYYIGLLR